MRFGRIAAQAIILSVPGAWPAMEMQIALPFNRPNHLRSGNAILNCSLEHGISIVTTVAELSTRPIRTQARSKSRFSHSNRQKLGSRLTFANFGSIATYSGIFGRAPTRTSLQTNCAWGCLGGDAAPHRSKIFTVVFGRVARLQATARPTVVCLLRFDCLDIFLASAAHGGNSLVRNAQLVSKVYFPRLLLPLAQTLRGVVDFTVTLVVLLVIMAIYRVRLHFD